MNKGRVKKVFPARIAFLVVIQKRACMNQSPEGGFPVRENNFLLTSAAKKI
jgi:hypothetical protein